MVYINRKKTVTHIYIYIERERERERGRERRGSRRKAVSHIQ